MSEWQKVKIGDVCTITKGAIGIQKAIAGKYPMVTLAEERTTHNEFQFDCDAVIVPLVSSTGHGHASMKRVHYQEGKFALGSILCAVVPNDSNFLNPKYLHIYLSYLKDKLLVPLMRGAANVSLSIANIKTVEIIVPSIEKQIEIIELEKKVRTQRHKLDEKNSDQNNYLANLRQQILQDAISGKLTIDWRKKNPDIEPASKLLEKIKAEKEKLIAEQKIKKEKPLPEIDEDEMPFDLPEKWEWCRPESLFTVLSSKGKQLKSKEYKDCGQFPIIDQGKSFICGYSDQEKKLVKINRPLIIFGDHTREVKFVDFDFIVGADGTKILNPIGDIFEKYLFFALKGLKINSRGYGRHFKILKNSLLPLPSLAEQKVIVAKIEKLMEHVSELEEKIKQNKQDAEMLMQSFLVEAFKN